MPKGVSGMKVLWACVLIAATARAQSQPDPKAAPLSLADLGIVYSLPSDWILATTMMRRQAAAQTPAASGSVLLAAVYVPEKKTLSESSPFFSLIAFRQAHPDCKESLDAMVPKLEAQNKTKIKNGPQPFSLSGNDFYRIDFEQKGVLRLRSLICASTKEYLLIWNAAARDEKGVEVVFSTLNSLAHSVPAPESGVKRTSPLPSPTQQPSQGTGEPHSALQNANVASGIMSGLLVKKVAPVYPEEARSAYIQGTVILNAVISKEGDIVKLEVMDGPIELVGSAVNAVRRWKYRPYTRNGEPVEVITPVQVNYQLSH